MQTENLKLGGAKVRKAVEAVLVVFGLLCIFYLAKASDAEVIGKSELFYGVLIGVVILLSGVYLQQLVMLLRQLMYPVTITIMKALLCILRT